MLIDDLIRMRGLKPKRNGQGRRGGYTAEQRKEHLMAIKDMLCCHIQIPEVSYKQRSRERVITSKPFVVTDTVGDLNLFDNKVDVISITYVLGTVFAHSLINHRQTVLLDAKVLQYHPIRQLMAKHLGRYYTHLWRCRTTEENLDKPLRVSTIFNKGLGLAIDQRRLSKTRDRFASAHRTLVRDGVIANWDYCRQEGPWEEWTVVIEPPAQQRAQLALIASKRPKTAATAAPAAAEEPLPHEELRAKRISLAGCEKTLFGGSLSAVSC